MSSLANKRDFSFFLSSRVGTSEKGREAFCCSSLFIFACTVGERKVGNAEGLDGSLSFCFLYVYFHGCIIMSCRLMVTDFAFDTFFLMENFVLGYDQIYYSNWFT